MNSNREMWFFGGVMLFLVLVLLGISDDGNPLSPLRDGIEFWSRRPVPYQPARPQQNPASNACLERSETKPQINGYSIFLVGTVKNNCDSRLSYVQIAFKLFDKQGNVVGNAVDNIGGLNPGQVWKYSAIMIDAAQLHHFEFDSLTAF